MKARSIALQCRFGGRNGWGHLMRCAAIAEEARERGWNTLLWTASSKRSIPEDLHSVFQQVLPTKDLEAQSMPSVAEQADVLLIDDMYQSDDYFERNASRFRRKGRLLAATDDLQRRSLRSVDLVINSQLGLREAGYGAARMLLGERYAVLRPGFRHPVTPEPFADDAQTTSVYVMVGGTDPFGLTVGVLRRLWEQRGSGGCRWRPVVVTGDLQRSVAADLRKILDRFEGGLWLRGLSAENVAGLMEACSVGVVGCGSTIYEAAAMRLPFVGLSLVDNQRRVAREVAERWKLPVLDCERSAEPLCRLPDLLESARRMDRKRWNPGVDAEGARRVLETIEQMLDG